MRTGHTLNHETNHNKSKELESDDVFSGCNGIKLNQ